MKTVWIDLDNAPHVLFFSPVIRHLKGDGHRVLVTVRDFGYTDLVPPREAVVRTAEWLVANPLSEAQQSLLEDPFDYPAEDALVQAWKSAVASLPEIEWKTEPGFGKAYSGPGGRPRSKPAFER